MGDHTTTGSISPFDYDGAVALLAAMEARATAAEAVCADLRNALTALDARVTTLTAMLVERGMDPADVAPSAAHRDMVNR